MTAGLFMRSLPSTHGDARPFHQGDEDVAVVVDTEPQMTCERQPCGQWRGYIP